MIATQQPQIYRFRSGALDHIMRSRNLTSDSQLAAAIGVRLDDLPKLRAGAGVTARVALKVSALQGDEHYISGLFEAVEYGDAAA